MVSLAAECEGLLLHGTFHANSTATTAFTAIDDQPHKRRILQQVRDSEPYREQILQDLWN
jgi:hypothetical protein